MKPARKTLWLVSLAVLLANDHWLKGAGWLPNVVTGKLSDFSGLIVAVALCASLSSALVRSLLGPGHGPSSRVCAWHAAIFVGTAFSVVKLSPEAAARTCRALGMIGLSWKIWPDPTDLVALSVLPWAMWVASDPWDNGPTLPSDHRPVAATISPWRLGLVAVSACACLATSNVDYNYVHAIVANDTESPLVVELSVLGGAVSCAGPRVADGVLRSSDFQYVTTVVMASKAAIEVDTAAGLFPEEYGDDHGRLSSEQEAALQQTRCLPVRVVVRRSYEGGPVATKIIGLTEQRRKLSGGVTSIEFLGQDDDNTLVIKERKGRIKLHLGAHLYSIETSEETLDVDPQCELPALAPTLSGDASVLLEAIHEDTQGCWELSGTPAQDGQGGMAGAGGEAPVLDEERARILACSAAPVEVTTGQLLTHTIAQTHSNVGLLERHDLSADGAQVMSSLYLDAAIERSGCSQVRADCGAIFVRADPPADLAEVPDWNVLGSWVTVVGQEACDPRLRRTGQFTGFVQAAH